MPELLSPSSLCHVAYRTQSGHVESPPRALQRKAKVPGSHGITGSSQQAKMTGAQKSRSSKADWSLSTGRGVMRVFFSNRNQVFSWILNWLITAGPHRGLTEKLKTGHPAIECWCHGWQRNAAAYSFLFQGGSLRAGSTVCLSEAQLWNFLHARWPNERVLVNMYDYEWAREWPDIT